MLSYLLCIFSHNITRSQKFEFFAADRLLLILAVNVLKANGYSESNSDSVSVPLLSSDY